MAKIIRGTTPTITYNFSTVNVANITTAYMTIKTNCGVIIKKSLTDATVGEKSLSWTLSQEDTIAVAGDAALMVNWKLNDGTRGASAETPVKFAPNHIVEVI